MPTTAWGPFWCAFSALNLDFGFSEARKAVDFFLVELQVEEEVLAIMQKAMLEGTRVQLFYKEKYFKFWW